MTQPSGFSLGNRNEMRNIITRLVKIPDKARVFSVSAEEARLRYRMDDVILDSMVELGLPARDVDGTRYFDPFDLLNSSSHLGCSPASRIPRRLWPAALNQPPDVGSVIYDVSYLPSCPEPGHSGDCVFSLALPGGRRVRRIVRSGFPPPAVTARVRLGASWPELPPEVREVLGTVADLSLMWLPEGVATDLEFARATRLADCAGVCRILFEEGRRRNLPTRTSFGLAVAPPFAVPHHWAEFRVSGVWVPVDPVLIGAIVGWGALDRAQWPPHRSVGPILARVSSRRVPFAVHGGKPVPVSLVTRRIRSDSHAASSPTTP